jgi:hypothetical protein
MDAGLLVRSQSGQGLAFFDSGCVQGSDRFPGAPAFCHRIKLQLGVMHSAGGTYHRFDQLATFFAGISHRDTRM